VVDGSASPTGDPDWIGPNISVDDGSETGESNGNGNGNGNNGNGNGGNRPAGVNIHTSCSVSIGPPETSTATSDRRGDDHGRRADLRLGGTLMNNPLTSPRLRKAANVLRIVLLIAIVAPFAVYAAPEIVGADESFVVLTPSMTPEIAPGDVVIVAERDPTAIVEGDVITFARGASDDAGDAPRDRRGRRRGGGLAFETQGDANEGPDPGLVVPAANLVGAVTLTIPYIGYVIQFAGTRTGFVMLVLLPFGLLAITEIWSVVRDRDERGASTAAAAESTDGSSDNSIDETGGKTTSSATPIEPAATSSGGVSVDAVGGAAAVLAAFAPYAVYVALQLRTAAAIAIAVGASTLLLGALAAWVPASGVLDRGEPVAKPSKTTVRPTPTGRRLPWPTTPKRHRRAADSHRRIDRCGRHLRPGRSDRRVGIGSAGGAARTRGSQTGPGRGTDGWEPRTRRPPRTRRVVGVGSRVRRRRAHRRRPHVERQRDGDVRDDRRSHRDRRVDR